MLEFNAAGLLVPSSVINSTLNEFEEYFAIDSPENIRRILYDQYIDYLSKLKEVCGQNELRQWIDGSFVTKKLRPLDIDLVTFIDYETAENKEKELKEFIYPASSAIYGIDGYIIVTYPENDKLNFAYRADCSYWMDHFDKTKPDRRHKSIPKGFLEIIV
jgi:hypothetical protein